MKEMARPRDFLLVDRENVPHQKAVELSIAQVVREVERDLLAVEQVDRSPQNRVDLVVAEGFRSRKYQLGFEPLANRQGGSPFPSQDRFEKLVFLGQRHVPDAHQVYRLIQIRLQLVTELGVAQHQFDFVSEGSWDLGHKK